MTDINSGIPETHGADARRTNGAGDDPGAPDTPTVSFVELLFFAYRDFTGEPDGILDALGFGRAHHRVLHFVHRQPGLRVADLLEILKITKQSLARVLKQLIGDGFIVQKPGETDRRERHLFVTERGRQLAEKLLALQAHRIDQALAAAGPQAEDVIRRFLMEIIAEPDRAAVANLVGQSLHDTALGKPASGVASGVASGKRPRCTPSR